MTVSVHTREQAYACFSIIVPFILFKFLSEVVNKVPYITTLMFSDGMIKVVTEMALEI
jgi:hypothetical protein